MSPKSSFEPLLKTALLGTGRDSTIPPLEGELQPFSDSKRGAENALLSAAITLTICQRVGTLPDKSDVQPIDVCPPETRPYVNATVTSLLTACIADQRELVPQALRWAGESGRIVQPSLLPSMLNMGRDSKELRRLIAPVLGERGRWLAQLNPDWRNVAAPIEDYETSWQEGETVARREALLLTRESDPAKARGWVEEAFKTDGAKERNQWLEILETGLSAEDEPFLEKSLDDKSKEVRATAVSLLEKLPDSRLVERARNELEPVLKWKETGRKLLGVIGKSTFELTIELPTEWRKEWARDGLEENPPAYSRDKNLGQRASWVRRWLTRVPPTHWEKLWGATPTQIIESAPQEWRDMLIGSWWVAAKNYNCREWLVALLAVTDIESLYNRFNFDNISVESANELMLSLMERDKANLNAANNYFWHTLMRSHPGPFSNELARAFLKMVREALALWCDEKNRNSADKFNRLRYNLSYMAAIADKFPLDMVNEATQGWPDQSENWEELGPGVQQFIARLQLRAALYNELKNQKI